MKHHSLRWSALAVWMLIFSWGWLSLNQYNHTPEPVAAAPVSWPMQAQLSRHEQRPTLLMFLHPGCPCSRASLMELEKLQQSLNGRCETTLVMVSDPEHAGNWKETPLQKQAAGMSGLTVVQDLDGSLAKQFSAGTSGETYLYSPAGVLLFHGGLTASRGHQGASSGQAALLKAVQSASPQFDHCSVFGCRLVHHSERPRGNNP